MSNVNYKTLQPGEQVRFATDRLRTLENAHYQIQLAKLAGEEVNSQQESELESRISQFHQLIDNIENTEE